LRMMDEALEMGALKCSVADSSLGVA
jgi:hypothetical protein